MQRECVSVLFVNSQYPYSRGNRALVFMEYLAHPSDLGYTEIHAEIVANGVCYSAVGRPPDKCVLHYAFKEERSSQPFVELVRVPVTSSLKAQRVIERLSANHATYQIPYMEFLVPTAFIRELDLQPSHWGHLFCSQFVLLCLREMRRRDLLALPRESLAHLDDCPSVTCTPAHLRHLLDRMLHTERKEDPAYTLPAGTSRV